MSGSREADMKVTKTGTTTTLTVTYRRNGGPYSAVTSSNITGTAVCEGTISSTSTSASSLIFGPLSTTSSRMTGTVSGTTGKADAITITVGNGEETAPKHTIVRYFIKAL